MACGVALRWTPKGADCLWCEHGHDGVGVGGAARIAAAGLWRRSAHPAAGGVRVKVERLGGAIVEKLVGRVELLLDVLDKPLRPRSGGLGSGLGLGSGGRASVRIRVGVR
eukprot:6051207-Prymnesium_polylepis.1